jgi:hypothetical protein
MNPRYLATVLLLLGPLLPACDFGFRYDCGPGLDGMTLDEVDQTLVSQWTYWYWADTTADQIGDYVEWYANETCLDSDEDCHGDGPICVCTIIDEETVQDCLLAEDSTEAYEYQKEKEAEAGAL